MQIVKFFFFYFLLFLLLASQGCSKNNIKNEETQYAEILLEKAREYYLNSEYEEAIDIYKIIPEKFSEDYYESAWATYEIGLCYFLLKEYKIAREYFVIVMQKYAVPKAVRILALNLIRKIDYGDPRKRSFY